MDLAIITLNLNQQMGVVQTLATQVSMMLGLNQVRLVLFIQFSLSQIHQQVWLAQVSPMLMVAHGQLTTQQQQQAIILPIHLTTQLGMVAMSQPLAM